MRVMHPTDTTKASTIPSSLVNGGAPNSNEALRHHVMERGINYLVHFTRVENLPNILQHGLLSRKEAQQMGLYPYVTDQYRYDNKPDTISLSIEHPNEKMFYCKRKQYGLEGDWVVLLLHPSILWEKRCAFYPHNAATAGWSAKDTALLEKVEAFEAMFYADAVRQAGQLAANQTTDVQAEVMVFERIEKRYLLGVAMNPGPLYQNKLELLAYFNVQNVIRPELFQPRHGFIA